MFPESMIALQQELKNWPMISEEMQKGRDLPEQLGILGARLGILLDGVYDIPDLCDMLVKKLRELRKELILDINYKPPQTIPVTVKEGAGTITIGRVPPKSKLH